MRLLILFVLFIQVCETASAQQSSGGLRFTPPYAATQPTKDAAINEPNSSAGLKINHTMDPTGQGKKAVIAEYEKVELKCKPILNISKKTINTGRISCDDGNVYAIESQVDSRGELNVYDRKIRERKPIEEDSCSHGVLPRPGCMTTNSTTVK